MAKRSLLRRDDGRSQRPHQSIFEEFFGGAILETAKLDLENVKLFLHPLDAFNRRNRGALINLDVNKTMLQHFKRELGLFKLMHEPIQKRR
jgi:hypothetical protein